jgi:hypothetical protein
MCFSLVQGFAIPWFLRHYDENLPYEAGLRPEERIMRRLPFHSVNTFCMS